MAAEPPTTIPLVLMVVGLIFAVGAVWAKNVRRNRALTTLFVTIGAICAVGWLTWAALYLP